MIKTFLIGAIPVGLFMYFSIFHTQIFVILFMGFGLAAVSYMIGETIREEFLND